MRFFAAENSIAKEELEEALLVIRHKRDSQSKTIPSFLEEVENGNRDVKTELSELQVRE